MFLEFTNDQKQDHFRFLEYTPPREVEAMQFFLAKINYFTLQAFLVNRLQVVMEILSK